MTRAQLAKKIRNYIWYKMDDEKDMSNIGWDVLVFLENLKVLKE